MADVEANNNSDVKTTMIENITEPINGESKIFGISVRGIIALILILTLCYMSVMKIVVAEPLYTLVTVVSSFYFGHQVGKNSK